MSVLADNEGEPWIWLRPGIRCLYVGTIPFIIIIYYRGLRERASAGPLLTRSRGCGRYTSNPFTLVTRHGPSRDCPWISSSLAAFRETPGSSRLPPILPSNDHWSTSCKISASRSGLASDFSFRPRGMFTKCDDVCVPTVTRRNLDSS